MTDVVISGDSVIRKAPAPPPTIAVEMPAPDAPPEQLPDQGSDLRLKRVSDPITLSEDGHELREEIRRQGRESDPIYEWKAGALPEAGEHESHAKQIRRASESMRSARMAALGEDLSKVPGATPERAQAAAEAMVAAPPVKVVPVGDNGQAIAPLRDDQPITELDSFQNSAEARRAMQNFRDAQDRERAALLESLQATAEREAETEREAEQRAQAPQPALQPDPAVQRAQAQAIAQARQEAQALSEVRRMSLNEVELAAQIQRHDEWAARNFPELYNANALVQMAQTNPARLAQLQGEFQRNNVARAQLAQHQQNRQFREYAISQHQAQQATVQRAAWAEGEDAKFNQWLAQTHPHFAKGEGNKRLMAAAAEIGSPDFKASYSAYGAARSFDGQKGLAAEAILHLGKQKNAELAAKRGHAPPPQTPGVYASARGVEAMDQVRDLQRQLDGATTERQALRIAQKLTAAKREAGLL